MAPLLPSSGGTGTRKRKSVRKPEMTLHSPDMRTANDRERERMRVQSRAFTRLRTMLPWVPADTKLSKLHTLRLAVDYIRYLAEMLDDAEVDMQTAGTATHVNKMKTWPFICNTRLILPDENTDMAGVDMTSPDTT